MVQGNILIRASRTSLYFSGIFSSCVYCFYCCNEIMQNAHYKFISEANCVLNTALSATPDMGLHFLAVVFKPILITPLRQCVIPCQHGKCLCLHASTRSHSDSQSPFWKKFFGIIGYAGENVAATNLRSDYCNIEYFLPARTYRALFETRTIHSSYRQS